MSAFIPKQETKNLARVILRSGGDVHICFRGIRSIVATPNALAELFSDPIEFIEVGSHTYKESTFEINRSRVGMDDVLGLTLATVNCDKAIVMEFPELFSAFLAARENEELKNKPLNMKSFETLEELADEKSFLLRYYLELTSYFKALPAIKRNIRLRDEVQFEIIREILNAFFDEELPEPAPKLELAEKIDQIENTHVLKRETKEEKKQQVSPAEYAEILGTRIETIYIYLRKGLIDKAEKDEDGHWHIDRDAKPVDWDLRKGRKRKPNGEKKHYKRPQTGSAADVAEYIRHRKLFTDALAPYIHSFQECDYYTKRSYHEVCWDGRHALIIDVNPDYISTKTGIRNRDLMAAGKAPVVPQQDKEEFVFHVHHIGQHSSSPFAVLPSFDHNGKEMSAYFHQGTPNTELHGPEFEAMKINFWKRFLEEYDRANNRFVEIPYLNPRQRNK